MRALHRLTARAVQTIATPGRHADGGGLYLAIKNGGKSWVFLFRDRATGRPREMGLGSTNAVPLAAARQKAASARLMLADDINPLAVKKERRAAARKVRTFGEFTAEYLVTKTAQLTNDKHRYQWERLPRDASPLCPMPIPAITTDDVRRVLEPIWNTKRETARRLRSRIEEVLSAAKAAGLRDGENPARWKDNLKPFFGSTRKAVRHHPALPYRDMPTFMRELRARTSTSALALEFTILTAARTNEVIGARWDEIDFVEKTWTVPADRMKAKKLHVVPLPDRAVAILAKMKRRKGLIFESATKGEPLSNMAMLECLRNLREGVTVHGFRSSFRDWAGDETTFPRDVAEAALAHKVGDETEAAYRRGTALKRRRELMEAWSRYLA